MTFMLTFDLDLDTGQGHIHNFDLLLQQGQGQRSRLRSLPSKIFKTSHIPVKCFRFLSGSSLSMTVPGLTPIMSLIAAVNLLLAGTQSPSLSSLLLLSGVAHVQFS